MNPASSSALATSAASSAWSVRLRWKVSLSISTMSASVAIDEVDPAGPVDAPDVDLTLEGPDADLGHELLEPASMLLSGGR